MCACAPYLVRLVTSMRAFMTEWLVLPKSHLSSLTATSDIVLEVLLEPATTAPALIIALLTCTAMATRLLTLCCVAGATAQTPETKPLPPPRQTEDSSAARRRDKSFKIPLTRQKSTRKDSNTTPKPTKQSFDNPPKTAPLKSDWQASSEMLLKPRGGKQKRGKSAERAIASESEDNLPLDRKEKDSRHAFVTGSKNVMSKAKTGGGNLLNRLGKLGRTGSNHEKELPDSEYVMKVINLPLIEQTRITRISKDLGSCRDKTEFWMPSLPWRCIE